MVMATDKRKTSEVSDQKILLTLLMINVIILADIRGAGAAAQLCTSINFSPCSRYLNPHSLLDAMAPLRCCLQITGAVQDHLRCFCRSLPKIKIPDRLNRLPFACGLQHNFDVWCKEKFPIVQASFTGTALCSKYDNATALATAPPFSSGTLVLSCWGIRYETRTDSSGKFNFKIYPGMVDGVIKDGNCDVFLYWLGNCNKSLGFGYLKSKAECREEVQSNGKIHAICGPSRFTYGINT